MEEGFKVRVDKVFGSLAAAAGTQRLESLWSLTDEEIERKEWNRANKTPSYPDEDRIVSSSRRGVLQVEDDDDLDDDDDAAGPSSRLAAKPDDHDEEEWMIRSSVGMDSTLDKEEEEDEFDQIAVGLDKAGDEICVETFEDDEATGEIKSFDASDGNGVMIICSEISNTICDERVGVKSVLKKDEKSGKSKSLKRVRFDSESASGLELVEKGADRSVKFAVGSELEGRALFPPPQIDPTVPDYLRNPSKYTQYTLDSASELNDEEANKKAYMDFFHLIRKKHDNEMQQAEDMSDYTKPITFMPRKKTGDDDSMDTRDPLKRGNHKENIQSKAGSSVIIAAADEACAMEEDETEMTPVNIRRKAQRQYRAKATLEPLDD